ncbi:MAG: class I SAM-dependent methyltransferase [Phycisphaeraceae bacterium]
MPSTLTRSIKDLCPYSLRKILAGSKWWLHERLSRRVEDAPRATSDTEARPVAGIFTDYYTRNHWGNDESRSGPGSTLFYTRSLRNNLPELISKLNITSMLDLPCGDFHWMRTVDLAGVDYLGADIVEPLIHANRQQHAGPRRRFEVINLLEDQLPKVDIIVCRDCLFHFSFQNVAKALAAIKNSGSTYLLTTTHPRGTNINIATGRWFPINLTAEPFNLPKPRHSIRDSAWGYRRRDMALWRIEDIPNITPQAPANHAA